MGFDNRILVFLFLLGTVLFAVLAGVAIGSGDIILPAFFMMMLAMVMMITMPRVGCFLAVIFSASGLTLPGLPGNFDLYLLTSLALLGCLILWKVYGKSIALPISFSHRMLLIFAAVVLMTGFLQGFGFQSLGSNMWGGLFYLQILVSATLVFTLPRLNMPARWWQPAIVTMSLLALLPTVATILLILGFPYEVFGLFLHLGDGFAQLLQEQDLGVEGGGIGRLNSAGFAAQTTLIGFLAFVPTGKLFNIRSIFWILVLVAIIGISLVSGSRLLTVMLPCTVFIAALLQRSLTPVRVILGIMASILGLILIYYMIDSMPYNIQRTVSWLPGLDVSSSVASDAEGTVDWRMDLWNVAVQDIPKYFWLGKGFSYDGRLLRLTQSPGMVGDPLDWALIMGWYHNGPLSLLLLLGIGGLLSGVLMMVFSVWRHFRLNFKPWQSPTLHLCHQALLASQIMGVGIFLTVAGDVQEFMARFLFHWALLDGLRACDARLEAGEPADLPVTEDSLYAPASK